MEQKSSKNHGDKGMNKQSFEFILNALKELAESKDKRNFNVTVDLQQNIEKILGNNYAEKINWDANKPLWQKKSEGIAAIASSIVSLWQMDKEVSEEKFKEIIAAMFVALVNAKQIKVEDRKQLIETFLSLPKSIRPRIDGLLQNGVFYSPLAVAIKNNDEAMVDFLFEKRAKVGHVDQSKLEAKIFLLLEDVCWDHDSLLYYDDDKKFTKGFFQIAILCKADQNILEKIIDRLFDVAVAESSSDRLEKDYIAGLKLFSRRLANSLDQEASNLAPKLWSYLAQKLINFSKDNESNDSLDYLLFFLISILEVSLKHGHVDLFYSMKSIILGLPSGDFLKKLRESLFNSGCQATAWWLNIVPQENASLNKFLLYFIYIVSFCPSYNSTWHAEGGRLFRAMQDFEKIAAGKSEVTIDDRFDPKDFNVFLVPKLKDYPKFASALGDFYLRKGKIIEASYVSYSLSDKDNNNEKIRKILFKDHSWVLQLPQSVKFEKFKEAFNNKSEEKDMVREDSPKSKQGKTQVSLSSWIKQENQMLSNSAFFESKSNGVVSIPVYAGAEVDNPHQDEAEGHTSPPTTITHNINATIQSGKGEERIDSMFTL